MSYLYELVLFLGLDDALDDVEDDSAIHQLNRWLKEQYPEPMLNPDGSRMFPSGPEFKQCTFRQMFVAQVWNLEVSELECKIHELPWKNPGDIILNVHVDKTPYWYEACV